MRPVTRNQIVPKRGENTETNDKNKTVSKKCQKMRRYRENVRNDAERLKKMRQKDRERKRKKREEQRQDILNGNRQLQQKKQSAAKTYMKRYRQKQKEKKAQTSGRNQDKGEKDSPKSLISIKSKKKEAVLRTQKWRLRVKMKDLSTESNETFQTELSEEKEQISDSEVDKGSPGCSRWTVYRGIKKVRNSLPETPEKRAAVVEKLIESPTVSKVLEKKGKILSSSAKKRIQLAESVVEEMSKNLAETNGSRNALTEKKIGKHALLKTAVRAIGNKYKLGLQTLGLSKKKVCNTNKDKSDWWKPNPRKKRKDRITENVKQKIHDFYLSAEISREVPNKKDVVCLKSKNKKQYIQKHVMVMTTADAFHQFKSQNQQDKIGFSSFKSLKPPQVRRVSETNRKSCLCQVCCNIALKADALKSFIKSNSINIDIDTDKKALSEMTLCQVEEDDNHNPKCLRRECNNCGTMQLRNFLKPIEDKGSNENLKINWYKWDSITVDRDDGSKKKIKSCVPKSTPFTDFLSDFEKDLQEYPGHRFRAQWQQRQMIECLKTLSKEDVMIVMDFSENYKCSFQNEIQSAYFEQNLVTIHPSMCYYRKEINGEDYLFKHSVIGISNDLKHDSTLVKIFEDKTITLVEEQQEVKTVREWSDGCAAQYKSRIAFAYLSKRQKNISRDFFETSHGKNVCDGLGAIVKNSCYRAMLTGKVIGTPQDVYSHCTETLAHGVKINEKEKSVSIRQFMYVCKEEVDRSNIPLAETLIGTRKLHAIRSTNQEMVVESRNLSCYCEGCRHAVKCQNSNCIDDWTVTNLQSKPDRKKQKNPPQTTKVLTPQPNPAGDAPSVNNMSPEPRRIPVHYDTDDFIRVKVDGRRGVSKEYIGRVVSTDVEHEEVNVDFMTETKVKGKAMFYWPEKQDIGWIGTINILKKLSAPVLSNTSTNRRVLYVFSKS